MTAARSRSASSSSLPSGKRFKITADSFLRSSPAAFVPTQPSTRFLSTTSVCTSERLRPTRKVSHTEEDEVTSFAPSAVPKAPAPARISLRQLLGKASAPTPFPHIVGHRGALYEQLENTLPGFQYCVDIGCHAVELDVFLLHGSHRNQPDATVTTLATSSGNHYSFDDLICFHGGGGDAVPGDLRGYVLNHSERNIRDLALDDIRELQFNPHHPEFACPPERIITAQVPTLRQVLETLKGTGTRVQIELKGYSRAPTDQTTGQARTDPSPSQQQTLPTTNTDVLQPCLALVEQLDMWDQVRFSSFDHSLLAALHKLRPKATLGALFNEFVPEDYIARTQQCGAVEVHLRYDTCTAARVAEIHAAGLGSLAWVRGPVGMRRDFRDKYLSGEHERATEESNFDGEDADCYRSILDTGVQQLCCNKPGLLKEILVADGRYMDPKK